eukprot:TRINITY_DN204_c2_g1_i3.p1 TRINITY_DN204_c2_g1~~TRINITY_DN204_c2_g1_i3.p1  ORF type:complete len:831 (+),score=160.02 TRINITY_DN204_c2_g1_i3:25-2493(+)
MGSAESTPVADPETLGTDGMLPEPGVLSHQILFDQHKFDFDANDAQLLSVDCAVGRRRDPINPSLTDEYIAVGLRTKFDGKGVAKYGRPPVNLVVVIDCSGSMKAHFRSAKSGDLRSKLEVAKQVLLGKDGLIDSLKPHDKLAILTFNTETKVLQDLLPISKMLNDRIEAMLEKQKPVGTTNLSQAVDTAVNIMKSAVGDRERHHPLLGGSRVFANPPPLVEEPHEEEGAVQRRLRRADTIYCQNLVDVAENRLMIITDEYLTPEDADHDLALNTILRHADESQIHTTFIAMGVNYPPFISTRLSLVAGCNVISVHSAEQFREKIVTEFDHICSPIAYNVTVCIETPLPDIIESFGPAIGREVIKVKSAFAGAGDDKAVHCAVGLLRLAGPITAERLRCTTSYIDRLGAHHSETIEFSVTDRSNCSAFRKAVVLARLGTVLKVFLNDEAKEDDWVGEKEEPRITFEKGIIPLPTDLKPQWEGGTELDASGAGVIYSASEGDDDVEGDGEKLSDDPLLEEHKKWGTPPLKSHGSGSIHGRQMSQSVLSSSQHKPVPQSHVSAHYKAILERFSEYLLEEATALRDPNLTHWHSFIDAIVHYIPAEEVTAAAEGHLTASVIYTGIDPDKVFDVLNAEKYQGRLRENHRMAVNKVFNKRMQDAILEIVGKVVEKHPGWVVATEEVKAEVREEVRGCFAHLENDATWSAWREKWDALVEAALRSVLHGKIFMIAKRLYPSLDPSLTPSQLTDRIIAELTTMSPTLPTLDTTSKTRYLPDLQSFITRWIVPSLEKYGLDCKWCPEQGVPISAEAADVPEIQAAQCPTQ